MLSNWHSAVGTGSPLGAQRHQAHLSLHHSPCTGVSWPHGACPALLVCAGALLRAPSLLSLKWVLSLLLRTQTSVCDILSRSGLLYCCRETKGGPMSVSWAESDNSPRQPAHSGTMTALLWPSPCGPNKCLRSRRSLTNLHRGAGRRPSYRGERLLQLCTQCFTG